MSVRTICISLAIGFLLAVFWEKPWLSVPIHAQDATQPKSFLHVKDAQKTPKTHIGGVRVHNYNHAFDVASGEPPRQLQGSKIPWMLSFHDGVTDEDAKLTCESAEDGPSMCLAVGHPSTGGLPFASVLCTEPQLETLLRQNSAKVASVEPEGVNFQLPEIKMRNNSGRRLLPTQMPPPSSHPWNYMADKPTCNIPRNLDRLTDRDGLDCKYSPQGNGSGVHVYVVDSGIFTEHVDFHGRAIPTLEVLGDGDKYPRVCNESSSQCADDIFGHGTFCAGIAGGTEFGVAKGVTLHAVKISKDNGAGAYRWFDVALDWIMRFGQRPAVVTASLTTTGWAHFSDAHIKAARDAGITVVVAAGNQADNACQYSPAYSSAAITVGATQWMEQEKVDVEASFSNHGPCVDIWAPGVAIESDFPYSTTATTYESGTSMAAPHVAGAVALLLGNGVKPEDVRDHLLADATPNDVHFVAPDTTKKFLYIPPAATPSDSNSVNSSSTSTWLESTTSLASTTSQDASVESSTTTDAPPTPIATSTSTVSANMSYAPIIAPIQTEASCSAHPKCSYLAGECCPTNGGLMLDCCEGPAELPEWSCQKHHGCSHLAGSCCPTRDGIQLSCCSEDAGTTIMP